MNRTQRSVVVFLVALWLADPTPAAADLDPGTGRMFLQGIIAVVAAGVAAIGVYWRQAREFYRKMTGKAPADTDTPKKDA